MATQDELVIAGILRKAYEAEMDGEQLPEGAYLAMARAVSFFPITEAARLREETAQVAYDTVAGDINRLIAENDRLHKQVKQWSDDAEAEIRNRVAQRIERFSEVQRDLIDRAEKVAEACADFRWLKEEYETWPSPTATE